jgi:hypothetical protein
MKQTSAIDFFTIAISHNVDSTKSIKDMVFKSASSKIAEPILVYLRSPYFDPTIVDQILEKVFSNIKPEAFLKVSAHIMNLPNFQGLPPKCLFKALKAKNIQLIDYCLAHTNIDQLSNNESNNMLSEGIHKYYCYRLKEKKRPFKSVVEAILKSKTGQHVRLEEYVILELKQMFGEVYLLNLLSRCKYVEPPLVRNFLSALELSPLMYLQQYGPVEEQQAIVLRILSETDR